MPSKKIKRNNSKTNFLSESIISDVFAEIIEWRRWSYVIPEDEDELRGWSYGISDDEDEFQWSDVHLSIVQDYYSSFSRTCDFGELPFIIPFIHDLWSTESASPTMFAKIAASFAQGLQQTFFVVPRIDKFHESNNRIKKYQLVEAFITFLVQLLYHKTYSIIYLCGNRIENLEKELRFLLTILGDTSFILCADDEHEAFQKLLAEFEAVANEAGQLVHSLFFSTDLAFGKTNEGIGVVLDHINLLEASIMKFLNLLPSISRSAYITPRTSVLDSLRIFNCLIYDLRDLMSREDNPIADVKDQIKRLHQTLIFMQSSIKDIGSPQPFEIGELKQPLIQIGDMAHRAEYLIISFLAGDAPNWYVLDNLTYINHKIELIGTELHEITKKYKFGELKVAQHFSKQLSLRAKRNTELDDVTVGLEDKAIDILLQLVGGTERLQFISIFGMAGLGKTTLAKKLYNHPSVNYRFDKLSWCIVSQTCRRQSILAGILIHIQDELGKDRILKMEEESLAEHVYKTLKGRRYLIIMDDMWDSNVWDDLLRYFPDDGNGSRILFTTRNKDVAPPSSIIFALPLLSHDQCWELLEKKVFDNKPCPSELHGIGKQIAANCSGLPLAVVVIAGILSTMDMEEATWKEVEENLASYIFNGGDNPVMQILELSYKYLPDHLKPCFLYFKALVTGEEIRVRKLLRLWTVEGFIPMEEKKRAEYIAEEYLKELIDKSLVMVIKRRSDGGVKTCMVHDLVRDLCLKISKDENFPKFVSNDYYAVYMNHLRAPDDPEHVCSSHGRILRVLYSISVHPHHQSRIEYLVNLRYLVIDYLPPSIGSLVNLEYLRLKTHRTVYLSSAVLKLKKLTHIHVDSEVVYDKDCNSSQTNNLEFLSGVIINSLKDEEMLRCSPHLRKLKLSTHRHVDLSFLTQLESLNIKFKEFQVADISFPSNIKKLTLSGFFLSGEKMSMIGRLENLEALKLRFFGFNLFTWNTRDGEFQKLAFLKLYSATLIQWNVHSSQHFPMLQRLVLTDCSGTQLIPSEIGEIPTLQLIEIRGGCPKSLVESARRIQQEQSELGNEELRIIINTADTTYNWTREDSILRPCSRSSEDFKLKRFSHFKLIKDVIEAEELLRKMVEHLLLLADDVVNGIRKINP